MDYDLFVIGAGSGGVRASRMAARMGARVAVCEERYLGGTCVNVGCVPKKILVYAGRYADAIREASGFGWSIDSAEFDWSTLIAAKDREISRLNGIYGRLLDGAGVELIEGRGVLTGPNSVRVGDREYTARHILVAVGGWPWVPDIPGAELGITSNEVFYLPEQPRRVVIVGGGYIALEFASLFNSLGSRVEVLYRGKKILRGFDEDVRVFLRDQLAERGIGMHCTVNVTRVDRAPGGTLSITLDNGETLAAEQLIWATGRSPNTSSLGLDAAGVDTDEAGRIVTDGYFQSSAPSVYALGDVANLHQLTPVALEEAMVLVRNLFGGAKDTMDYEHIATAVFSTPEVATVGLNEEQARAQRANVTIFRTSFRPLRHTISGQTDRTMMKLVVDADTDKVLGVHVVGEDAAEMVQSMAVALKCGATKAQLDATVGIHPTAAEELVTMREPVS